MGYKIRARAVLNNGLGFFKHVAETCGQHPDAAVKQVIKLCDKVVVDVIVGCADKKADSVCLGALHLAFKLGVGTVARNQQGDKAARA